ncbi:MAG TPA: putative Ig domain-containing protein, partial [Bryobacteraceae bacterium]|nr:putative Ig domain-containing protein [Bryobacteraceae bacterium]
MRVVRFWALLAVAGLGLAGSGKAAEGTASKKASAATAVAPAISIVSQLPASGGVFPLGQVVAYALAGAGGTAPYTFTAIGTLPPGVTLLAGNRHTVQPNLSGDTLDIDPSVEGNYSFTIQATDANGLTGTQTYAITVPGFTGPLTSALPNAPVGVPYSQQLYAFDNDPGVWLVWSANPALPCGLSISASGLLSGTPGASGTCSFNLTVTAQRSAPDSRAAHSVADTIVGSASFPFSLTVSSLAITSPHTLPAAIAGVPYSYQMAAAGGSSLTWSAPVCPSGAACPNGLPYGLTMSASGLISGTPAYSSATFTPLITVTDGVSPLSLPFALSVHLPNAAPLSCEAAPVLTDATVNQPYEAALKPTGGVAPYAWSVPKGLSLPPGLMLLSGSSLPSDQPPGATVIAGQPSAVGQYSFSLTVTDSVGAQITGTFSLNVSPLNLAPGSLQTAILNSSYAQQLTATGGTAPYTFSLAPAGPLGETLPEGLSASQSGLISGADLSTGFYSAKLTVKDSASNTLTRTISLNSTDSAGTAVSNGDVSLQLGSAVNIPLTVAGGSGQYTWSVASGALPPGLSVSGSAIAGTTTAAGTFTFTVAATNTSNTADVAVRQLEYTVSGLQIVAPALNRTIPGGLPAATVGSAYQFTLKAANGAAPYAFSVSPFTPLPAGLTLDSSGSLHGTPAMSGVFPISVTVTDAAIGSLIAPAMYLTIAPQGSVAPLNAKAQWKLNDASVGAVYTALLDPILEGGTPPYTWSVAAGSARPPVALAAGSNGVSSALVGMPATAGTYPFSLSVTDSGSPAQTLTVPFSLHVSPLAISVSTISGSSNVPGEQSAGRGTRLVPRLASPAGAVGTYYSTSLDVSGGVPPYSVAPQVGFVPGLSLSPNVSGTLEAVTGVPAAAGVFPLNLSVTDANGQTLNVSFEFLVDDASHEVPTLTLSPEPVIASYTPGSTAPGPVPVQVTTSSGSLAYSAAVEGISFASLSSVSGTTPGMTSVNFNVNAAGLATSYGLVVAKAPGAVNQMDATPVTFTVNASPQTISFTLSPNSIPFGTTPPALNATASSGLTVSYSASPSTVCTVSGSTLTIVGLGACSVTASQAGNTNYLAASVTQTLTVTQAPQTITFPALSNVPFGGTAPVLNATASSGLTVSYSASPSTVCTVSGSTLTIVGVGACSVTASQAGNTNYLPATSVIRNFSVTQASQTITFPALSNVPFGGTAPALTATASSGLPVSYTAGPPAACTVSGSTLTIVGVGPCSVTASQGGNANYAAAASVTRTFSVTLAAQTISFGPLGNAALGGLAPGLNATASSSLPVSYSAGPSTVCSIAGSSLTLAGTGTCSVTASQGGNSSYAAATPVTQSFSVLPALTIATTALPAGAQQSAYSQSLGATGGTGGNVWSISSGGLPAGLSLSSGGGISGTPSGVGPSSFTVRVTDSNGDQATQPLSILIDSALTILTTALPDVANGVACSLQLAATGGAGGYSWSVTAGSLPTGISLASSGSVSGTSTATGTSAFTVTVTDSAGNQTSRALSLKVDAGVSITTSSLPAATQGSTYSAALGATGGTGVFTWSISSGGLPAGLGLSANGVLAGTPAAAGSASFTVKATDQRNASATQALTLQVNAALTVTTSSLPAAVQGVGYSQSLGASGGSGTLSWSVTAGSLPGGLSLSSSGAITGTPGSPGASAFTVLVTDQAGNRAQAALGILVNPPLTIQTTSLKNAIDGAPYAQSLAATGGSGTYTWSISGGSLPSGLSLSSSGTLSGTPNVSGPFSFTAQVTDQAGNTKTQGLSLQVNAALAIGSSTTIPNGITGKAYSASLTATGGTGGPYAWSVASGALPPGVALSAAGALTGNPSAAGAFSFTVQVSDGVSPPAQVGLSTTVYNVLAITTTFLPNGTVGQSYGPVSLAATGGSGTVTWSVGGLPNGLGASSSGSISGTPGTAGSVTVTVTATDATSVQTVQTTLGLTIVAPASPLTISPSSLVLGAGAGGTVSGGFTATGGTPPLTWSISGGSLPAGVTLNASNGGVSGTVSQPGNTSATVSVTDGKTTATAQLTINVLGFTTTSIPAGAATVPYSAGFAAAGGTPPYVFSASGL